MATAVKTIDQIPSAKLADDAGKTELRLTALVNIANPRMPKTDQIEINVNKPAQTALQFVRADGMERFSAR
jgi:hypothetical protein